jgi:Cdc6-like AAA superfamily ATPase
VFFRQVLQLDLLLSRVNTEEYRADVASTEDSVDQGVIQLCAALAARDSGSARQALDLLRLAGDIAENQEAEVINEDHVADARSQLEQERVNRLGVRPRGFFPWISV